jgi:rhamnulokinase
MPSSTSYLAIDLGAESGRGILASLSAGRLTLSEIHRFANVPIRLPEGLVWNILQLWSEIRGALALAAKDQGAKLSGIGVDAWGVDFALLDRGGALLANPHHYRDGRTDGMLKKAFRKVPRERVFARTGIQIMQINTLYQLLAMATRRSRVLDAAETFVTIPDLVNYWLTGRAVCELTNATTTQCFDPRKKTWARPLLRALGIPTRIFPPVKEPGTRLGELLGSVGDEVGLAKVPVLLPACHDTGSAVVAVPAEKKDFAWLSCGTWSILGTEVRDPVIDDRTLASNFTNEGGVFGTFRLSKNIMGLWLVQECRRTWARGGDDRSYEDLTKLAGEAPPLRSLVDPDDPAFLNPGDMPARIRDACRRAEQPIPEDHGAIVRTALESVALKYRWVLERLEAIVGKTLEPLYMVGGGTRNHLLCQLAADATGRTVVAGPVEATATGNALMQAIALGHVGSLEDARTVVRRSFAPATFEPTRSSVWQDAYARFLTILARPR